jgi:hypothetical protein
LVDKCQREDIIPILHTVYGTATGIRQEMMFEENDYVQELGGISVVNCCQGYTGKWWALDDRHGIWHNTIVITTGSKFYRGAPNTGAVFVPPIMMQKL